MTPNILKFTTFTPAQPNTSSLASAMDGDTSAKKMDAEANSASNADFSDAVARGRPPSSGQKTTSNGTSVFDRTGAVVKAFATEGAIGGTAQEVGGPFDKEGVVGKQFTEHGSLGKTAQAVADKSQS